MLENRLLRREPSKVTVICDTIAQRGLPLLKSFVVTQSKSSVTDHIILLLLDSQPEDIGPNVRQDHVTVIVSDPLSWLSGDDGFNNSMHRLIPAIEAVKDQRVTVVIDSLTSLILLRSMPYTCCLIHKVANLGKDVELVGLVHEDCHEGDSLALLYKCATTLLRLQSPTIPPAVIVHVTLKKTSGKILKKREQYLLNEKFQLVESRELSNVVTQMQEVMSSVADPTKNLTFNLSLSAKEKRDRETVPLPYVHHKSADSSATKIFYQPDDADDFDEEDPDDDLDI